MKIDLNMLDLQESEKLDFKESYGFMRTKPHDVEAKDWDVYVKGQWDEFSKDVIALSNGGLSSDASSAYIVVGVRESEKGNEVIGVDGLEISKETMLKKLNTACLPTIPDIRLHFLGEDKQICVIEIPYTSKIIESSRDFRMYSFVTKNGKKTVDQKSFFSKHCVFYRIGDTTDIASLDIKNFLLYTKSSNGQFKIQKLIDEIERNLCVLVYKNGKGDLVSPIYAFRELQSKVEFKMDGFTDLTRQQLNLLVTYCMCAQSYCNDHDHRVLDTIINDSEFCRFIEHNYENSSEFFNRIIELRIRSSQLIRRKKNLTDDISNLFETMDKIPDISVLESKNVLMAGTHLARIYDITVSYIAIIQYLKGNYRYILEMPLSPLYIAKSEIDAGNGEAISLTSIRDFIESESVRGIV